MYKQMCAQECGGEATERRPRLSTAHGYQKWWRYHQIHKLVLKDSCGRHPKQRIAPSTSYAIKSRCWRRVSLQKNYTDVYTCLILVIPGSIATYLFGSFTYKCFTPLLTLFQQIQISSILKFPTRLSLFWAPLNIQTGIIKCYNLLLT